jgi:hypothetical protein
LKKDLTHGFQFLAAYTFSKSIDDAADSLGTPLGGSFGRPILGQVVYNDQNNVAAQRGVSGISPLNWTELGLNLLG